MEKDNNCSPLFEWLNNFKVQIFGKEFDMLSLVITFLWAIITFQIIFFKTEQSFTLVGLAALLASASVMKNIANTNKIEENRENQEKIKNITFLTIHLAQLYNRIRDLNKELHFEIVARKKNDKRGLDLELLDYCIEFIMLFEKTLRDKDVIFFTDYNEINKLYKLNNILQNEIIYYLSEESIKEDNGLLYSNIYKANEGIKKFKKDFDELEAQLIYKYGDEIPTLEMIMHETYKDMIF